MGLFNFRLIVAITLLLAVFAIAGPALEARAPTLNVAPVIDALNSLSSTLTTALTTLNGVQTEATKDASSVASAVGNVANGILGVTTSVAAAAGQKLLTLGQVATQDVTTIVGQVNQLQGQIKSFSDALTSSAVTQLLSTSGTALGLVKAAATGGFLALSGTLSTLSNVLGSASSQISSSVTSIVTALSNIRIAFSGSIGTS